MSAFETAAIAAMAFFAGGALACAATRAYWRMLLGQLLRSLEPCPDCGVRTTDRTYLGARACRCEWSSGTRGCSVSPSEIEARSAMRRGE